jgi:hypothetical protein
MPRPVGPQGSPHRAARSTSSSTTRSASPPTRASRAPRPIRRTWPRWWSADLPRERRRPEAVVFAAEVATEYRPALPEARGGRHVLLSAASATTRATSLAFTQPLMYRKIRRIRRSWISTPRSSVA